MGLLVDGKWTDKWYDTDETGGKFVRSEAQWRDWITADGTPAELERRSPYHNAVVLECQNAGVAEGGCQPRMSA